MKRTTLYLDERQITQLKKEAVAQGKTLTAIINEALGFALQALYANKKNKNSAEPKMPSIFKTGRPTIDISDRSQLYDLMDSAD
jgi:hypothetical protein